MDSQDSFGMATGRENLHLWPHTDILAWPSDGIRHLTARIVGIESHWMVAVYQMFIASRGGNSHRDGR